MVEKENENEKDYMHFAVYAVIGILGVKYKINRNEFENEERRLAQQEEKSRFVVG